MVSDIDLARRRCCYRHRRCLVDGKDEGCTEEAEALFALRVGKGDHLPGLGG